MENWAPPGSAWEKDNVGLQVGEREAEVTNVLLSLDIDGAVVREAQRKNCNLIISHHPLIFYPIKSLDFNKNPKAELISNLIKSNIAVFSAHTNLDFTKNGVNYSLAERLELKNIRFLDKESANQYKLIVFIPSEYAEKAAEEIFKVGGGQVGDYKNCSFTSNGLGNYEHISNSDKKGPTEETRIEIVVDSWNLNKAVKKMLEVHPYEEPYYDIYPLKNENTNFGFGAIGELENSLNQDNFLEYVCQKLKTKNLRFTSGKNGRIKKVAVFGGAGIGHLKSAIAQGADAYITGDVKYHEFQDAEKRILLVDAGHYETEIIIMEEVKKRLIKFINDFGSKAAVYKYSKSTNPINFYNI